jgi:ribonuclease E
MKRRMLINVQRPEELRVAVLAGEQLESYQTALAESGQFRGNIYRGVVVNLQGSLNAAFVDFGAPKDGFLAFHDVVETAYHRSGGGHAHRVDEVLQRGKPILVQITKDQSGSKGAALTTNVSLAGRYLVLTPFDPMRGVSRKVEDDETRKDLRDLAAELKIPEGCGLIVRTNALDQTKTALSRDLAALLRLWKKVQDGLKEGHGPRLLYSDQDLIVQALRDYLDSSISEVLVDTEEAFEKAQAYMKAFMPRTKTSLVHYTERMPLFSAYDLEPQIESIMRRVVDLPGGGSIVIDRTEALTAIDVNSGRAGKGGNPEDSLYAVNLEAAREVARQLRLRDIGGLVVVDFIDMRAAKHRHEVERTLREAMKPDKARNTVGKISPNGLLEINRQRLKQSLELRTRRVCPTCAGAGSIASAELVSLGLLRSIETEASKGRIRGVRIELHPELADSLQNNRRQELAALEREFDIHVEVIAATGFHRSQERIEWLLRDVPLAIPLRSAPVEWTPSAGDVTSPAPKEPARRGRGRRKGATVEAAEVVEAVPVAEPEAEVEDEAAEGGDKKKRRRKRGGKRHKKGKEQRVEGDSGAQAAEAGGETPTSAVTVAEEPSDAGEGGENVGVTDAVSAGSGETAPASGGKSRRRRRGGRRRGKGPVGAETSGDQVQEVEALPPVDSGEGDAPDAGQPDGQPDGQPAKHRRRRRPRRKGKQSEAGGQ